MSKENDGGPAFPRTGFRTEDGPEPFDAKPQNGMTLRDWFAGQYAVGVLLTVASKHMLAQAAGDKAAADKLGEAFNETAIAQGCYSFADAMLEARKK